MANSHISGLRWVRSKHGHGEMPTEEVTVASAYGTELRVGQPIKKAADGTATLAAAGEAIYGVIVGVVQYWDAANGVIIPGKQTLPASTTWGSVRERRSILKVVPVEGQIFAIDGATAAITTEAGYEALQNENCDHSITSGDVMLDLTTRGTATAQWRVVEIPNRGFQDFASAYVRIYVEANESQQVPYSTAGVGVGT